ncbi:MAG: nucleotidyl transferase AbiEii/AbiGii toxin family protein [Candidatus Heimdallarchaeota archaeon]|nr:nucleotidyl transferase AbiEii/AbiGii toxin family protein [Candidatus Heimdallarchaeota archaeon]
MITRQQLRKVHSAQLPLHVFEQDYIQALFLQILFQMSDSIVFKGGTFLKHAYGLDRFSEDLDFTILHHEKTLSKNLETTASKLSLFGVEASIDQIENKSLSLTARLVYNGPLFDGSERSRGHILIETSKRNDVFFNPEWIRLFFPYPEIRVISVLGLRKQEVFAEKLRALSMRKKPRDLYDIWFLLKQQVKIDSALYEKKMNIVNKSPIVSIDITDEEWKRDLNILLEHPPPFEMVKKEVIAALKANNYSVERS